MSTTSHSSSLLSSMVVQFLFLVEGYPRGVIGDDAAGVDAGSLHAGFETKGSL
jgi:hypothetical protein